MIIFSDHAVYQIRKRRISKTFITKVIMSLHESERSYRGRVVRRQPIGKKMLEVITVTEGSKITVVTAYFTKG